MSVTSTAAWRDGLFLDRTWTQFIFEDLNANKNEKAKNRRAGRWKTLRLIHRQLDRRLDYYDYNEVQVMVVVVMTYVPG